MPAAVNGGKMKRSRCESFLIGDMQKLTQDAGALVGAVQACPDRRISVQAIPTFQIGPIHGQCLNDAIRLDNLCMQGAGERIAPPGLCKQLSTHQTPQQT